MNTDDVFSKTIQSTNTLLNDLEHVLENDNRQQVYHILRGVLHATRDRLSVEETAELGAQLPMLVRGLYYEGWNPGSPPVKDRSKASFLMQIRSEAAFLESDRTIELVIPRVIGVLQKHITRGEYKDVLQSLPSEIRELFPGGTRSA